ncbi:MAG: DUF2341 domain-containing protein [Chitinispirillaceae bacterium]|nr:DUF2341 domain-containing protein [Chitinispirillaceae bacterium]
MSNLKYNLLLFATLVLIHLCQCSSTDSIVNGSSSETVIGKVYNNDGTPACSTIVTLFPGSYDPVSDDLLYTSISDTTDASGYYFFKLPDDSLTPSWSITAIRMTTGTSALITNVYKIDDTTVAEDAILKNPGTITVTIVPDSGVVNGYLYIPGTRFFTQFTDGNSWITLDSVPAGVIPQISIMLKRDTWRSIKKYSVVVEPEQTTRIDYPQWEYSRQLYLNTSPDGADVAGMVTGFPVLVRLRSANFSFNEARSDGADIRFVSSSGVPLHFEIERWDSGEKEADIWVKVDTVRGNNEHQYITMYWGNADAISKSNSIAIFDTSEGFQGVWHMSETGSSTVFDATANHLDGTVYNTLVTTGVIGNALHFDGSSSHIIIDSSADSRLNMPQNGTYAMTLWVFADTIDADWQAIAGKGHEQYYMQSKGLGNNRATWEFVEFQDNRGWEYTEDSVPPAPGPREWVHLVGVRNGDTQQLYINGEKVVDGASLKTGNYPRVSTDNFTIGCFGRTVTIPQNQDMAYFNGMIDEVCVLSVALSADWIKLCYMNQRTDDKLVKFK